MSTSGLSPACQHLFTAKSASGLTFGQLGSKIGRDEVWVAALFFGSAKADHDELLKLAKVLNLEVAAVSSLLHEYPSRGCVSSFPACSSAPRSTHADPLPPPAVLDLGPDSQLWESPPRDPLIYRCAQGCSTVRAAARVVLSPALSCLPRLPRRSCFASLYEMLVVYSLPIKAIINEKMGDGIMSAIDFRASVESACHSILPGFPQHVDDRLTPRARVRRG